MQVFQNHCVVAIIHQVPQTFPDLMQNHSCLPQRTHDQNGHLKVRRGSYRHQPVPAQLITLFSSLLLSLGSSQHCQQPQQGQGGLSCSRKESQSFWLRQRKKSPFHSWWQHAHMLHALCWGSKVSWHVEKQTHPFIT